MEKTCKACGELKPLISFYRHQQTKDGRRGICILCFCSQNKKTPEQNREYRAKNLEKLRKRERERRRESNELVKKASYDRSWRQQTPRQQRNYKLKLQFGITIEDYELMVEKQKNICAICKNPESSLGRSRNKLKALSVDHCHKTGQIRGLLCDRCNRGMGLLRDCPEILLRAASYIVTKGL